MKIGLFVLVNLLSMQLLFAQKTVRKNVQKSTKNYTYSLKVTVTQDYCGGAAPSPEMLAQLRSPKPFAKCTLYVVDFKGAKRGTKILKTLITDSNGQSVIQLPKGKYAVLDSTQIKPFAMLPSKKFYTWDEACLKKKWETPMATVLLNKTSFAEINVYKHCFYSVECGNYNGPLPP